MMNWKSLLAMLVVALFVVGCASQSPSTTTNPAPTTSAPAPAPVVAATPGIEFVSVPAQGEVGKAVMLSWKVTGADTVEHTAIHYGTKSHADVALADLTTQTYPSAVPKGYFMGDASKPFETSFVFGDVVTVYLRAHTIVGGKSYWTDEKMVKIVVPAKAAASDTSAADAVVTP